MSRKLVEEVVNDICGENPHSRLVGVFARVAVNLDIERQDGGVLGSTLSPDIKQHKINRVINEKRRGNFMLE